MHSMELVNAMSPSQPITPISSRAAGMMMGASGSQFSPFSFGVPADDLKPFEREKVAFQRKRPFLRQHVEEFVAIHNGNVVASDKSRNGVLKKFFAKYPVGTSVYVGFVGRTPPVRVSAPLFIRRVD